MNAIARWMQIRDNLPDRRVELGKAISNAHLSDPKMLGFICARYKFVAKMLAGRDRVLEVGCGEAFGTPIVAAEVGQVIATDSDASIIAEHHSRPPLHHNIGYGVWGALRPIVAAAYAIDVIEHVPASEEHAFMEDIVSCLCSDEGTLILGTPNAAASKYASQYSRAGHVNLKTHDELRVLGQWFFHAVFMFGQNDEVVHTGFGPMCHYLWMVGVGPK